MLVCLHSYRSISKIRADFVRADLALPRTVWGCRMEYEGRNETHSDALSQIHSLGYTPTHLQLQLLRMPAADVIAEYTAN
jgi:hypothetical protein